MIRTLRTRYNAAFQQSRYDRFIHDMDTAYRYPIGFKVSETPLFLSRELRDDLLNACETIIATLQTDDYKARTRDALPTGYAVPNEDAHSTFLQFDFAICQDTSGRYVPRLIELQGFPSLFAFQAYLDSKTREYFDIPADLSAYFNGLDYDGYVELLRQTIIADSDPEQVVLMDAQPDQQKTRMDFACTEALLGIRSVCVSDIKRHGRTLFYERDGRTIPITRIYNRLIRDDPQFMALSASDTEWLSEAVDVTWVGHPNWFYKISKYSLPLLHNPYTSEAYFLRDLMHYPPDLENFVLKPLFLFSGAGIELDITSAQLDALPNRDNYILQHKVQYAPLVETPDGYANAEVRIMGIWNGSEAPRMIGNLVRMSKGRMMGVRFNVGKTWVGSSIAYSPYLNI